MEISVRVVNQFQAGMRRHYCLCRSQIVAVEIEGLYRSAAVFCPLCGASVVDDLPDVRPGYLGPQPDFAGPRCAHGYPDAPCTELIKGRADYEYDYVVAVPEYRALGFLDDADRLRFPTLTRWARPCPQCRDQIARSQYGLLEHELRSLCSQLSEQSQAAQDRVLSIDSGLRLAHALLNDVHERVRTLQDSLGEGDRVGYVYGISDGSAIKIGWSAGHPTSYNGRLSQLQTASAAELQLVGAVVGTQLDERSLHRRFAEHRIRGEWFRHVPEIVEYFCST